MNTMNPDQIAAVAAYIVHEMNTTILFATVVIIIEIAITAIFLHDAIRRNK